jgi:hypothetical protein
MPAIALAPRIIQGVAEVAVLVQRNPVPKHEIIEAFLVSKLNSHSWAFVHHRLTCNSLRVCFWCWRSDYLCDQTLLIV